MDCATQVRLVEDSSSSAFGINQRAHRACFFDRRGARDREPRDRPRPIAASTPRTFVTRRSPHDCLRGRCLYGWTSRARERPRSVVAATLRFWRPNTREDDRPEPKRRDAFSSRLRRASRRGTASDRPPFALNRLSRSTTSRRTSPRSSRRSSTRNITPPGTASSGVTLGRTSRTRRSTSFTSTSGRLLCFCSSLDERGAAAQDEAHRKGDVEHATAVRTCDSNGL